MCNPFEEIDFTSCEAYQQAAEGFIGGIINAKPCDIRTRGVELRARGLPIYPECVSVPVEDEADVADSGLKWLMKGACTNYHHRSYANFFCREYFLKSRSL
jgi:hypothetical protein